MIKVMDGRDVLQSIEEVDNNDSGSLIIKAEFEKVLTNMKDGKT